MAAPLEAEGARRGAPVIAVRLLKRPSYPQHGCTSSPGDVLSVTEELAQRWTVAGIAETVEAPPESEVKSVLRPPVDKQVKAAPRHK